VAPPTTMRDMAVSAKRETLLLRGTLDMCVLALLADRPTHAYGVVQRLHEQGFDQTSYGTVYPLVSRLRGQGLLEQSAEAGDGGPARHVLTVTDTGRATLDAWIRDWREMNRRVEKLVEHT
jgi:PadR family transcriptional regulator, regulatory protein PadR